MKEDKDQGRSKADVRLNRKTGEIETDNPMLSGLSNSGQYDALNPNLKGGQMQGSHSVNINTQTDLELGAIANPGGLDPAFEKEQMADQMKKVRERAEASYKGTEKGI